MEAGNSNVASLLAIIGVEVRKTEVDFAKPQHCHLQSAVGSLAACRLRPADKPRIAKNNRPSSILAVIYYVARELMAARWTIKEL